MKFTTKPCMTGNEARVDFGGGKIAAESFSLTEVLNPVVVSVGDRDFLEVA